MVERAQIRRIFRVLQKAIFKPGLKMKTLILGAKGMLGTELVEVFPGAVAWDIGDADITNKKDVNDKIRRLKPELVINAAAYTDVDKAENDKEKCFEVNAYGVDNLAKVCKEVNAT